MRIYKAITSLTVAALLGGCTDVVDVGRSAPDRIAVADNSVVVAGPPGYCVDPAASKTKSGGGAFVLLGSCASISQNAQEPSPVSPGVLTVTVSANAADEAAIKDTLDELAAFFRTNAGRAALSRTGNASTVVVSEVRVDDGVLLIRATDSSPVNDGIAPEVWRALFGVNDRLLSASVSGFEARPLSSEDGFDTLEALTRRIRAESPDPAG